MKPLVLLLFLLSAGTLVGADLITKSGKVYKECSIVGVTDKGVTVEFATGVANVPLPELPDDLRAKYSAEWERKQAIAQQRADAALDRERGKAAEPVAAIRTKLQQFQKAGKPLVLLGKDGKKIENCRIHYVAPGGVTIKLDGVPVHLPFREIATFAEGELSAPAFVPKAAAEPTRRERSETGDGKADTAPPRTILTGPRGGKYYINKNGRKTYLKTP